MEMNLIVGLEALAYLDKDDSGVISGSERDSLYLWQDANSDGNFDSGETSTLYGETSTLSDKILRASSYLNTSYLYELPESYDSSLSKNQMIGAFSGVTVARIHVFLRGPCIDNNRIPLTRSK